MIPISIHGRQSFADVIMPFRSKPFDKKTHLKVLIAIFGVAVFIFLFSLLQQNQKIALFFAITAAIFAGGSGAVIIGVSLEKRYYHCCMDRDDIGAFISVGGVLVKQISSEWLADTSSFTQLKEALILSEI